MEGILAEVVDSRPSSLRRVVTLTEAEKIWSSTCRVLRAQLIQGHPIALPGRTCGFYYVTKPVVKDGDVKYSARTPHFGFHPSFITKFSLDTAIVRVEGKEEVKLPLEYVADDCSLPTEFVHTFLQEVFLFIGEVLFRGRLLRIDFDGVASVLVKREKAIVSMDSGFLSDIFSIDSRKWPVAVRDLARPLILRPSSPTASARESLRPPSSQRSNSSKPVSRPVSAGSRPSSGGRPSSSCAIETPRAAFVSTGGSGKLFAELAKVKPRKAPVPKAGLEKTRRPMAVPPRTLDPAAMSAPEPTGPGAILGELGEDEEESIYSVLSPDRQRQQQDLEQQYGLPGSGYAQTYDRPMSGQSRNEADSEFDDNPVPIPRPAAPSVPQRRPWSGSSVPVNVVPQKLRDEEDDDQVEEDRHVHFQSPTASQIVTIPPQESVMSSGLGGSGFVNYARQATDEASAQSRQNALKHRGSFGAGFALSSNTDAEHGSGKRRVTATASMSTIRNVLFGDGN
jgi:hypothetical protein